MRSPSSVGGELEADARGHDRELLERLAAGRRRGGATRASTASTTVAGTRVRGRGQRLGDEERVAAGDPVEGVGVGARARRQPRTAVARERRQREPPHRAPGQAAEQALQRVRRAELVVAEAEDEHGGQRLDPPRDVAEHVDRRVVGPVDVLDDERRRRRGRELGHDRGEDGVDGPVVGEARPPAGRRTRSAASRSGPSVRGAIRSSHDDSSTRARRRRRSPRRRAPRSSCRSRPRR